MASDWQPSKLGDVIAVNPSRPLVKGSHSVYISMQQVETANRSVNEIDHRTFKGSGARFQNGDTLLARITPCLENGKTAYVDFLDDEEVGHGSTEFIVLSGIEGVSDDLFVYYLARFPEFRNFAIVRMEGSSGRQRVPAPTLKKYVFACPSYDEQRAIAHILGSLDDKIELNHRMNRTLEAMARAIFKSWFVDFDPVRAKAEGRPTGLPDDIAALFPDSFEDSELGEIPKGWEISDLGALSHILNGFAFKSKDYCGPEGIRVLRTKNFTQSGYASKNTDDVFLPKSFLSSHKQYICEPFDFHLVMVGASVGNTTLLLPNMLPALRNQNMWCFRPKKTMPSKFYLNYAVQQKVESVMSWADGSARSFFRKSDFRKHKIIVPTEDLLRFFEGKIKGYFDLIAANTAENETLASLRDTLLPKLISGELRVPDAEKFVEEAGL